MGVFFNKPVDTLLPGPIRKGKQKSFSKEASINLVYFLTTGYYTNMHI